MVDIVLFFATCMYTVVWGHDVQCMQAQRTMQSNGHRESIYTGTKFTYKGPIVWANGDLMHVQKNNDMRYCVYKGPTVWGSDAQIGL